MRLVELNIVPGIPAPVEKIALLCGYRVLRLNSLPNELSGIVNREMKMIGINSNHSHARQRFSLAHELGHIILKHPAESACTHAAIRMYNREADRFASELLIPSDDLLVQVRTKNFQELTARYRVSGEALNSKLKSLRLASVTWISSRTRHSSHPAEGPSGTNGSDRDRGGMEHLMDRPVAQE